MKQLKRVVFILEDGRMKYATHHGEITKWTDSELMLLKANFDKYGDAGYTSDFKHYGVVYDELKARWSPFEIVAVIGFEVELITAPLTEGVII